MISPPTELKFIEPIQTWFLRQCREEWKSAAEEMPKSKTYKEIKDSAEIAISAKSNLPRNEHILVVRLLCGILPLEVKAGCFKDKLRQSRYCKVCNGDSVEDEIHFIFLCNALSGVTKRKLDPTLREERTTRHMNRFEELKWLLNKVHIKEFSKTLACIYQARQDTLYIENWEPGDDMVQEYRTLLITE